MQHLLYLCKHVYGHTVELVYCPIIVRVAFRASTQRRAGGISLAQGDFLDRRLKTVCFCLLCSHNTSC
jgi:hypothetical protein